MKKEYITTDEAVKRLKNYETVYAEEGSLIHEHTSHSHWMTRGLSSNNHYIMVEEEDKLDIIIDLLKQLLREMK